MSTLNFANLINADVTLSLADDVRGAYVADITAIAPAIVPELTGKRPARGSAEQSIMEDILAGYVATGMAEKTAKQARTRLLNAMRIVAANPRVEVESDADYAQRVMDARTVANVGDTAAILAAIAGKGEQAKAAAKVKRANAAKAAADRKADAAKTDPAKAKADAAKAKADADAAKATASKVNAETAKADRAAAFEAAMVTHLSNARVLAKALESGEIDPARWAKFVADAGYALAAMKSAKVPVATGTTGVAIDAA